MLTAATIVAGFSGPEFHRIHASAAQPVHEAPVLAGFGGTLAYVQQDDVQLSIASTITVSESGSNTLTGATVAFTNWQAGDRLGFFNDAALQYNFSENLDSHTAVLTLTGTRTLADYQQELRTLAFFNVAGAPVTTTRVVSIQVDGIGLSNIVSEKILFIEPPVVSGFTCSQVYVKGGSPLSFAANVVIVDSESTTLKSATFSFSNWNAGDRLAFVNSANLQHIFSEDLTAHVATLKLSGTATVAAYQSVLRSLTFANVAGLPVTTPRKVSLEVSDGISASKAAMETIVFGQAPVLSGFGGTLTYIQDGPQLMFASTIVVSDADSATLSQATVAFTNWQLGDRLGFFNDAALQYSFSKNLTLHTAVLTLTGTRSLAAYQEELRTLAFFNVAGAPDTTTRTASITVESYGATSNTVSENLAFQLAQPTVSIAPASTTEDASGSKLLSFVVTLSSPSTTAVTATYATSDLTATAGSDYAAKSGILTIAAGQTSGTINVLIYGDTDMEPDETFLVTLSSPNNAVLGTASAVGTILSNETSGHVLSDNTFDSSSGTYVGDSTHYLAASFETGSDFAFLNDLTLLLARVTSFGNATVEIYTGFTQPETSLGALISPNHYSTSIASTIFTTDGFVLLPGTKLWVVLKPTSGTFQWSWTSSTTGAGSGYTPEWSSSADGGATWSTSLTHTPQMKVTFD